MPAASNDRYRRYLNRRDVRRSLDLVRQIRGRKQVENPQGRQYDLQQMFEELNFRYFFGLMACPRLGWSPNASRTLLGHYDPSHNAIVLSRILDRPETPRLAVEYVLYHEMLHLRHPAENRGARRCVHTPAFKEAEKQFDHLKEASGQRYGGLADGIIAMKTNRCRAWNVFGMSETARQFCGSVAQSPWGSLWSTGGRGLTYR